MKTKSYKRFIIGLIIATLAIAFVPAGFYAYSHSGIQPGQCYGYQDHGGAFLIMQVDQVLDYGVVIHITNPDGTYRTDHFYVVMDVFRGAFTRCDCNPVQ